MSYFEDNYHLIRYPIATESSVGLRGAQIGAIHAIASHFTLHGRSALHDTAIVIMPNGSGKTAVLMMSAFVLRAKRVLVVTPSRLVRDQVTREFQNLTLLRGIGAIEEECKNPDILMVDYKLGSDKEWEALKKFDVVVSTPNCTSPKYVGIPKPPQDLFDLLLIDEGHHSPAKTWRAILSAFPDAKKVMFTATPFRLDKREIEGTTVYEFSIREAYDDKIFGDIKYVKAQRIAGKSLDVAIAKKAQEVYEADKDQGYDHRILVRTDRKSNARELKSLYEDYTNLNLRVIHSGLSLRYVDQSVKKLRNREIDGIICVDMLGEGFDLPNLKIAALHAPHESFPVTLQFIGRLARTKAKNIGTAKIIAVPRKIRTNVKKLYDSDKNWQEIIPDLYEVIRSKDKSARLYTSQVSQTYISEALGDEAVKDLSLYSLMPLQHVKIYELPDGANLDVDIKLNKLEVIRRELVGKPPCLILFTKETKFPQWASSKTFASVVYDLSVVYFDRVTKLLFVNSSRRNEIIYQSIASQLAVNNKYRPLSLYDINRVLVDLEIPEFFSIGMRNRLWNSPAESYRTIAGPNAPKVIVKSDGRIYHRGHVFGRGQIEGESTTLGYSSSSKVWSNTTSSFLELTDWCKSLAKKIASREKVVTGSNLDYLSVGKTISTLPSDEIFAVDWNEDVYINPRRVKIYESLESHYPEIDCQLLDLDINIDTRSPSNKRIRLRIQWRIQDNVSDLAVVDYSPSSYPYFRAVKGEQKKVIIVKGWDEIDLVSFLNERPLRFYTVHQALIFEGNNFIPPPDEEFTPYDVEMIEEVKWELEGVDMTKEVGNPRPSYSQTIHQYMMDRLESSSVPIVFYDHGSGEIADFITFAKVDNSLDITFYHVKASGGEEARARLGDVYEVCGQAVKSLFWTDKAKLLDRIEHRLETGKKFVKDKGDINSLKGLIHGASFSETNYRIIVVQPGISQKALKTKRGKKVAEVLASSNDYIVRANLMPMEVIASG
jgi:superfamily II DNA or RNA helicase